MHQLSVLSSFVTCSETSLTAFHFTNLSLNHWMATPEEYELHQFVCVWGVTLNDVHHEAGKGRGRLLSIKGWIQGTRSLLSMEIKLGVVAQACKGNSEDTEVSLS